MSKYGKTILWMGLIIMTIQIAVDWPSIRSALFTPSASLKPSGGSGINVPNFPIGVLSASGLSQTPPIHRIPRNTV